MININISLSNIYIYQLSICPSHIYTIEHRFISPLFLLEKSRPEDKNKQRS